MGQAKKRGTYEERKTTAIEDNARTIQLLKEQEEAWWNSLTPEEQERVAKNRVSRAKKLAMLTMMPSLVNGDKH
jgi:hypothetical protein